MREEDPLTGALQDMWSMIVHNFRTAPFPINVRSLSLVPMSSSHRPQLSPAAFGLLFCGISMALMLFGIVAFVVGFLLMPLVIMLVVLFYFAGIVAKLSESGRNILSSPAAVWNHQHSNWENSRKE